MFDAVFFSLCFFLNSLSLLLLFLLSSCSRSLIFSPIPHSRWTEIRANFISDISIGGSGAKVLFSALIPADDNGSNEIEKSLGKPMNTIVTLLNATHAKITWNRVPDNLSGNRPEEGTDEGGGVDGGGNDNVLRTDGYRVRINLHGRPDHLGSSVITTRGATKRFLVISLCSSSITNSSRDCSYPWQEVIFAEVMAYPTKESSDQGWKASEWSANSPAWPVAYDCKESEYLRTDNMKMPVNDWTCVMCPLGSSCAEREVWDGGVGERGIQPLFGWWKCTGMSSDDPAAYIKCRKSTTCLGAFNPKVPATLQDKFKQWRHGDASNGFQQVCHPDRLNPAENNTRCSMCNATLGLLDDEGSCGKCDPGAAVALLVLVLLLIVVLFCILIVLKMKSSGRKKAVHSTIKRLILNHLQIASVIMSLKVPWPPALLYIMSSMGGTAGLSSYAQFLRCIRNDSSNLNTSAGTFYGNLISLSMSIFVVTLLSGLYWIQCVPRCPQLARCCITKNDEIVRSRCCPSAAAKAERKKLKKAAIIAGSTLPQRRSTRDGWVVTIVYYIYCLYPNLLRQSFMAFECVEICGTWSLAIDDKEECYGSNSRHTAMVFAVALPVVLFIGILCPLLVLVFLWSNREILMTSKSLIFRFGLLYSGYAYSRWWWECLTLVRKILLISIVTFEPSDGSQVHLALGLMITMLYTQERGK